MWTRRPTVIGDQTSEGDFVVLRRDRDVGRVNRSVAIAGTQPYEWSTWTYPCDNGRADDLDDALNQLREAIRRRWSDEVDVIPMAGSRGTGGFLGAPAKPAR